jgi:hypothetical protein
MPTPQTGAVDQIDDHDRTYCPIRHPLTRGWSKPSGVAQAPRG